MAVLIYGDTVRSREMRHEVPLAIPDPFLYIEQNGQLLSLDRVQTKVQVSKWRSLLKGMVPFVRQKIDISARQIPPADSAGKENVAANEHLIFARVKTKTPRTMTGNFQHLKLEAEKIAPRRFFDKEIGLGRLDF